MINNLERQVGRKREHLVSEHKRLEELADQVEVVRSTLSKAASEMAQTRSQCSELVAEIDTNPRPRPRPRPRPHPNPHPRPRPHPNPHPHPNPNPNPNLFHANSSSPAWFSL